MTHKEKMDICTEDERAYHMDLIEDAIEVYENRRAELKFPIEEHIDLVIRYEMHVDLLSDTSGISSVEEYKFYYDRSEQLAKYIVTAYKTHNQFDAVNYYNFCKTVDKMMSILFNETGKQEQEFEDMFANMKM